MREGRKAEVMRHWQAQTASFWAEEAYGMPEGTKEKGKWDEYRMGSRKYTPYNRWERARKGLLHKER